jgi:hypothetical protein
MGFVFKLLEVGHHINTWVAGVVEISGDQHVSSLRPWLGRLLLWRILLWRRELGGRGGLTVEFAR